MKMKTILKMRSVRFGLVIFGLFLIVSSGLVSVPENESGKIVKEKEFLNRSEWRDINRILLKDKARQFQGLLEYSHDYYNFNGHFLVASKGEIIFDNFIGYADFSTRDTLAHNSVYQLASVSKQFTAMAAMILQERGELDYEDKMVEYVPELEKEKIPYYDSITIKHLLNHTSGLSNYMYYVERYTEKDSYPYNDEVVKLLARHTRYLNFVPGTRFSYCNTGYIILALIVERVSGQSFAAFVEENIFKPLEMGDSFVYSRAFPDKRDKDKLEGYRWHRGFYPIRETQHDGVVGDKGVYSTARDLYKWDRALYSDILVSDQTMEEAFSPGKLNSGRDIPYGYGFRIKNSFEDGRIVYHNGLWNGFRTGIFRNIDEDKTIIILDHSNCRGKGIIMRRLEKILVSPDLDFTRVLVEKAINDGSETAIDIFKAVDALNLGVMANMDHLKEVHHYLYTNNKQEYASRIENLISSMQLENLISGNL